MTEMTHAAVRAVSKAPPVTGTDEQLVSGFSLFSGGKGGLKDFRWIEGLYLSDSHGLRKCRSC